MHIIYARKSSESEERQALSIPAQLEELKALATRRGVRVGRVFEESCSAKTPGRPVWQQVMQEARNGRINGIICWKLDRLARNPVDGGQIMWELGQGKLAEIVTPGRTFTGTSDDKLLMSIEFGMATKYVDDLSENVKRGNRKKLEAGWLPGPAPVGYLNDRIEKTIVRDPERFELVQRMWRLLLNGKAGPREIQRIANEDWGFRTRKTRRAGGKPLSRSHVYMIFHSIFYAGFIERGSELFEGAHEPMISRAEFEVAQKLITPSTASPTRRQFFYTGLMRCGECGAAITAEYKTKPRGYKYIYYHCTHQKPDVDCRQPSIEEKALEAQIATVLDKITLPVEYYPWLVKTLEKTPLGDFKDNESTVGALDKAVADNEKKAAQLLELRLNGMLSDEEYIARKNGLIMEKDELTGKLRNCMEGNLDTFEPMKTTLERLVDLKNSYFESTGFERRQILQYLSSNRTIKDKTLLIELKKPFSMIGERHSFPGWLSFVEQLRTYYTQSKC